MCERDLWREGGWVFVFGGGGECGFRWVRCGCWCYDYLVDRSYCVLGLYPFSWQDTRFRGLPRPSEDKRDTSNSARLPIGAGLIVEVVFFSCWVRVSQWVRSRACLLDVMIAWLVRLYCHTFMYVARYRLYCRSFLVARLYMLSHHCCRASR